MTPSMGMDNLTFVGGMLGRSQGMCDVCVQEKMNSSVCALDLVIR